MQRALKQLLEAWQAAGLSHLPHAEQSSVARWQQVWATAMPEPTPVPQPTPAPSLSPAKPVPVVTPLPVAGTSPSAPLPMPRKPVVAPGSLSRKERESALCEVSARVAGCQRCPHLAETRTQTVFGVGNPEAKVMFIGEAPGADEDATGEPFVGKAGQLLNKIITACGWKREDLYICNILRCRPPGNRTPEKAEADHCREYLDEQIRIVNPEYIVCWGSCAAQNLLASKDAIGKMRQRWFTHGTAKVLCTYHPSYLLRNPEAKKPVWEDMKLLLAEMGLTPPGGGA